MSEYIQGKTCPDCGSAEINFWSGSLCRRCACKGGHSYDFWKAIDVEKLETLLGRDKALEVLKSCSWDGY